MSLHETAKRKFASMNGETKATLAAEPYGPFVPLVANAVTYDPIYTNAAVHPDRDPTTGLMPLKEHVPSGLARCEMEGIQDRVTKFANLMRNNRDFHVSVDSEFVLMLDRHLNGPVINAAQEMYAVLCKVWNANHNNKNFPPECLTAIDAVLAKASGK